jgi:hypothetical protein
LTFPPLTAAIWSNCDCVLPLLWPSSRIYGREEDTGAESGPSDRYWRSTKAEFELQEIPDAFGAGILNISRIPCVALSLGSIASPLRRIVGRPLGGGRGSSGGCSKQPFKNEAHSCSEPKPMAKPDRSMDILSMSSRKEGRQSSITNRPVPVVLTHHCRCSSGFCSNVRTLFTRTLSCSPAEDLGSQLTGPSRSKLD